MQTLLAAIADDFTGGSDLAGMLQEGGVRTVQIFGLRAPAFLEQLKGRYGAAVLSLKSRSIAAQQACEQSLEALHLLRILEPRQVQFKYCSTFDSTREGNIGPVTEALMDAIKTGFTIALPALPVNGRTQYLGHLFVGGQLLSETHMRHHPLNPMTDSNLVRHLQAQCRRRVGLIELPTVQAGVEAITARMRQLEQEGVSIALVDAVTDADVARIADAVADLPLLTGGSALGMHLPAVWRRRGLLEATAPGAFHPAMGMPATVILAGSCSAMTLRQLELLEASGAMVVEMNTALLIREGAQAEADRLFALLSGLLPAASPVCVRSSASPSAREAARRQAEQLGAGAEQLSLGIEAAFGLLAARLVKELGVRRLVVAGGETSGAVIEALDVPAVEIRGTLDPGVPALVSLGEPQLGLALKSGNFGGEDFFLRAVRYLQEHGKSTDERNDRQHSGRFV